MSDTLQDYLKSQLTSKKNPKKTQYTKKEMERIKYSITDENTKKQATKEL